ncbi:hypothetical protein ACFO6R_16085 [Eubacterium multiforme]|uniref:Autotransporter adhesin n=1 Tax=Eubacterium multiforme TaxID=83339 RepID=A0ABT9UTF9_9FIRM|nr:hypothetical protein [Eubacterium multiforme]MDQ0149618.1 autotransporter adhesin [Eubacterium multiforme]
MRHGLIRDIFYLVCTIIMVSILIVSLNFTYKVVKDTARENTTVEFKTGKIIDSSKENINGLLEGHIEYETAIKVDDEIMVSNNKGIYYEAVNKIGKEVKVKIENNKKTNDYRNFITCIYRIYK